MSERVVKAMKSNIRLISDWISVAFILSFSNHALLNSSKYSTLTNQNALICFHASGLSRKGGRNMRTSKRVHTERAQESVRIEQSSDNVDLAIVVGVALARARTIDEATESLIQIQETQPSAIRAYCNILRISSHNQSNMISSILGHYQLQKLFRQGKLKASPTLRNELSIEKGSNTYIDGESGYTVFTSYGLLSRTNGCCGVVRDDDGNFQERIHRCRHCPFDADGTLSRKDMVDLAGRLNDIGQLRDRLYEAIQEESSKLHHQDNRVLEKSKNVLVSDHTNSVGQPRLSHIQSTSKCDECGGKHEIVCQRCAGLGVIISPELRKCVVCEGNRNTPCPSCTIWKPRVVQEFP